MDQLGKAIECKAAVLWKPGQSPVIEVVEVAPPKAGEIRVKMEAVGICYSDVSLGTGRFPDLIFPTVLGHEGVGIVESTGEGVTSFRTGDTVLPIWAPVCGQCALCKRKKRNICNKTDIMMCGLLLDKSTRLTCKGMAVSQATGLGLFSEYVVIPELCAVKVSPCASPEKLTPYGCCVPSGYGAVVKTARVDPETVVAVWGLGAIGLCVVLGCRDSRASRIIGIDINPDKFEIARQFGCTDLLNPQDYDIPVPEIVKNMTNGNGVDYAFVCVGNTDAMADGFKACGRGAGECIIVGIGPHEAPFPVNHYDLVNGKSLKGSHCGDLFPNDIKDLAERYHEGSLPTDLLITNVIQLEEINKAIELLKSGKAIRSVIKF